MRTPDQMIDSTKYRIKAGNNTVLAERLGMTRQTLAHKRKYPTTFTGGDIAAIAKLLNWSDEEIVEFVRGIREC